MTAPPQPPRLLDEGRSIEILLDGTARRFHAIWLRDNAQDPETRDPVNGQRRITLLDLPPDTRIAAADWRDGRLALRFAPDGKCVAYDPAWLAAHSYDRAPPPPPGWTDDAVTRWDAVAAGALPIHDYRAIVNDADARRRWLAALSRYGFARLSGAPAADGVAVSIATLFGFVRETNYGRAFDVRAEARPTNLAFTSLALQPHTDNPYRDPVPGLQILACLRNDAEGGETILVDGFEVVRRLQAENPAGFVLLADHCARFAYEAAGTSLRAKRPLIELAPDGELIAIRFNNRSAAPAVDIPFDRMTDYYAAYRALAGLIEAPDLSLRFRLEPGDALLFDNMRILHGRTAVSASGDRWLQGCYVDRDGLFSTLRMLEKECARG